MKPQRVYAELRRALPPDTIVALDAGAAPAYGYDRLSFAHPRTFLTPLDLGGLGFAFPVALGAKLGRPEAPVLAVHGDGGFLMNSQEIETAVRHGINAVTLVMNNNCWGSEKAYQKHFYGERYIGCDIGNPRYDQYARLFGAEGYYVDKPEQVGEAIQAALGCGKPAVIEIPIDPDEFPVPVQAVRRDNARAMIRAHLLRRRPRPHAQRTESTPRVRPSGAASQLDPSHRSSVRRHSMWTGAGASSARARSPVTCGVRTRESSGRRTSVPQNRTKSIQKSSAKASTWAWRVTSW